MDSSSLRKNVPLLVVLLFILFMYVSSNIAKHSMKDPKFSRDLSTTYPKTAYQALFTQKSDKGEGHAILSSDGCGHLRLKEQASVLKYTHDTVDPQARAQVNQSRCSAHHFARLSQWQKVCGF
jgi:hypothetical protein